MRRLPVRYLRESRSAVQVGAAHTQLELPKRTSPGWVSERTGPAPRDGMRAAVGAETDLHPCDVVRKAALTRSRDVVGMTDVILSRRAGA